MSQRQLALVFPIENFRPKTKPLKINSLKSKTSPNDCSESPFLMKARRVERVRPGAARTLEELLDDILLDMEA